MDASNNVFRGATSVADYFDPDRNPPLPLVEIPNRLNPYRTDGVRIYAKMLTCLPAQNVKSLPGMWLLLRDFLRWPSAPNNKHSVKDVKGHTGGAG